jgi:hypothetical protein
MSAVEGADAAIVEAAQLDRASVATEDGQLLIKRPLADGTTDTEDVHQLAFEHGLEVRNCVIDTDAQEIRVWIHDSANGGEQ